MLVSRRAYAAMRGVTEGAVRKAIAAGKIPTVNGMVDSDVADAAWARNRDAGQASRMAEGALHAAPGDATAAQAYARARAARETFQAQKAKLEYEQAVKAAQSREDGSGEPAAPVPVFETAPLTAARTLVTEQTAAIRTIQRRKLEGTLLEAEEVDQTWAEILQVCKDRLRLIADNIAPTLASCTIEAECRSVVMREVDDALTVLSKGVENLAATA